MRMRARRRVGWLRGRRVRRERQSEKREKEREREGS